MGYFRRTLPILCSLVAIGALANVAHAQDCLNGLRPSLMSGDFSGSVDCLHDRLSVERIGTVRIQEHEFTVYDYRYRLAPVCDGCAIHGGQRILIFDRGGYEGQYKPDGVRVTLESGRLLFWPRAEVGSPQAATVVEITQTGFPTQILVDGEVLSFFR